MAWHWLTFDGSSHAWGNLLYRQAMDPCTYFQWHGLTYQKYTASVCEKICKIRYLLWQKRILWFLISMHVMCNCACRSRTYRKVFHSLFAFWLPFPTARIEQCVDIVAYTYLPVSICSHTQIELTPCKLLNMTIISLNLTNLPFLSWSHSPAHY